MKLLRIYFFAIIGFMPIAASAAIIAVDFTAEIYESNDQNFDDITGTYFTMEGTLLIDTSAPVSGGIGNYPGAVIGMDIYRDGIPLLSLADFTCGGSCANDVFVSGSQEANVYVQDFFVGNLDLNLLPATGVAFNNDIDIFLLAAQGSVTDYFDVFSSSGSVQVDGEDYFNLYDLNMSVVSQVPIPAAAWLFGSGLLGLIAVSRRV